MTSGGDRSGDDPDRSSVYRDDAGREAPAWLDEERERLDAERGPRRSR